MESTENNSDQLDEDPSTEKASETPVIATENITETNTERSDVQNVKTGAPISHEPKITHLPLSRIKHIMKLDGDITVVPLECVFLVTKATELFVQSLAREACSFTQQNDKKTLQKRDIDSAISQVESLVFLEETL